MDSSKILAIRQEVRKVIVGQEKVVDSLIRGILANGHILVEGVPGLAKTVIIRTLAIILGCDFKRIQFTIDLLPSDIIGINSFDPQKSTYKIVKGPIFTNILLADEINRASPKVQSALLEGMAERQVTIGNQTLPLADPFFVFATENPLESLGTYPLPQAQLDRFIFKILIHYPNAEEELEVIDRNFSTTRDAEATRQLLDAEQIRQLHKQVSQIHISEELKKYIVQIIEATRTPKKYAVKLGDYIEVGCGPRATIAIVQAAKAEAFMNGREYVTPHDIKEVAYDVLRHRINVNYLGQAKEIHSDKVIQEILLKVPLP
ncbi:MAG: AAA family ATPase [Nanoarchaeota archaeon]